MVIPFGPKKAKHINTLSLSLAFLHVTEKKGQLQVTQKSSPPAPPAVEAPRRCACAVAVSSPLGFIPRSSRRGSRAAEAVHGRTAAVVTLRKPEAQRLWVKVSIS